MSNDTIRFCGGSCRGRVAGDLEERSDAERGGGGGEEGGRERGRRQKTHKK